MLAFVLAQLLLCGLFIPLERMVDVLEIPSGAPPATHAYDLLATLARDGALGTAGAVDLSVTFLALILAAATLRGRTEEERNLRTSDRRVVRTTAPDSQAFRGSDRDLPNDCKSCRPGSSPNLAVGW
jgi:hypothetical protein